MAPPILPATAPKPAVGHVARALDETAKIRAAAAQFESLLIGQMLKSVRNSSRGDGWGGESEDSINSSMIDLGTEQFASALSSGGGLGLARMIVAGLEKQNAHRSKPASTGTERP